METSSSTSPGLASPTSASSGRYGVLGAEGNIAVVLDSGPPASWARYHENREGPLDPLARFIHINDKQAKVLVCRAQDQPACLGRFGNVLDPDFTYPGELTGVVNVLSKADFSENGAGISRWRGVVKDAEGNFYSLVVRARLTHGTGACENTFSTMCLRDAEVSVEPL